MFHKEGGLYALPSFAYLMLFNKITGLLSVSIFMLFSFQCEDKSTEKYEPPVQEIDSTIALPEVSHFLTKANATARLDEQSAAIKAFDDKLSTEIQIDIEQSFQEIDGFGFAITGGTALHLSRMSESAQTNLLNELFGDGAGQIGLSFIRISIGASDLDMTPFSYNDLPAGETDENLEKFSIAPDEEILIPILKKILAINPEIKIMASPWSPPTWMKDNQNSKGGSLLSTYYGSYALYFAKYIEAMSAHGITISHITIQNEPLHPGNNPSMYMSAEDQRDFIRDHLGPMFQEKNIETKIVIYDHNVDKPNYPISILNDPEAKSFIDGSAFHLYAGNISALSTVRNAHPEKAVYFTEQWYGAPGNFSGDLQWHIREVVIGSTRNWSRAVIEWNLSSNNDLEPHTDGGCTLCLGALTIDDDQVVRNAGYYVIGHVSKFVRAGSVRVLSSQNDELPNVAFITPDQEVVLLVLNNSGSGQSFNISDGNIKFSTTMDAGSVSTFTWKKDQ